MDHLDRKSFQLSHALPDLTTLVDRAEDLKEIETLRQAMNMTQHMATAQDSDDTESDGDGDVSDGEPAVERSADDLDEEEEMDAMEAILGGLDESSELPMSINISHFTFPS